MKKNLLLIAVLIVLGLATWLIVGNQEKKSKSSFDFSYREFAVENIEDIHKMVITKRTDDPHVFTRKSDHWMLNDTWKARQNAVDNVLDVIKNIKIDYVPPNSAIEHIMNGFLQHGIKVELYDKRDKVIKKYYVGISPDNGIGSYFVMEGSDKPLVMSVPSMRGSVHPRFNYSLDEWRDMTVLDLKAEDIASMELSYPFNKKFSFRYDGQGVYPLHELQKKIEGEPNTQLLSNYLKGFEQKVAEYIENNNPRKDEMLTQVPFCEMRIEKSNGKTIELSFYYHKRPDADIMQSQTNMMQAFNPLHAERFFIKSNWGDVYLGQHIVFKDIFWKYDSFFKK